MEEKKIIEQNKTEKKKMKNKKKSKDNNNSNEHKSIIDVKPKDEKSMEKAETKIQHQEKNPEKSVDKMNAIKKFNDKHKNKLKKVLHKTIDKGFKTKSNGLSDERLKAFGFNPKKFNKLQKYGSNYQNTNNPNVNKLIKNASQQKKKNNLKKKLQKALNTQCKS